MAKLCSRIHRRVIVTVKGAVHVVVFESGMAEVPQEVADALCSIRTSPAEYDVIAEENTPVEVEEEGDNTQSVPQAVQAVAPDEPDAVPETSEPIDEPGDADNDADDENMGDDEGIPEQAQVSATTERKAKTRTRRVNNKRKKKPGKAGV